MKRFLLILATLLLSHSSLMAQTKEFLQWYQNTRHRIERASEQDAEGAEVVDNESATADEAGAPQE